MNESIVFDNVKQWVDWNTNSNGYSGCYYYVMMIYNGIVYKEMTPIVTCGKTMKDIKNQISASRKMMLLMLIDKLSDNLPHPIIKENISTIALNY